MQPGKFARFLCHRCNAGLGLLREDSKIVERLLIYVRWCEALREALNKNEAAPVLALPGLRLID